MAAQKLTLSPGRMTQALRQGLLRQGVALGLCATMLPFAQLSLMAQEGSPQQQYPMQDPGGDPNQAQPYGQNEPAPAYIPQSPQQLQQLVAPIALYPDALVAQTLAGATFPQQVEEANNWMHQNGGQPPAVLAEQVNQMPWDPSVKALTQFPSVLDMLARGQQWTTALGNAYYNQPADVMTAVQSMRYRAREAGQLRNSEQQVIVDDGPEIIIQPANPQVVYVPYYNPWVVYGEPVPVFVGFYRPPPPPGFFFGAGIGIGFGIGIGIGVFSGFGWGCHAWAPNWRSNTIIVNHNTYISNSTTVNNYGHFGAFNQGFQHAGPQGFQHAAFNRNAPLYNGRPVGPENRPPTAPLNRASNPGLNRPENAGLNRPNNAGLNRQGTPGNAGRPQYAPGRPNAAGTNNGFNRGAATTSPYSRPSTTGGPGSGYGRTMGTNGGTNQGTSQGGYYGRPGAAAPSQAARPAAQMQRPQAQAERPQAQQRPAPQAQRPEPQTQHFAPQAQRSEPQVRRTEPQPQHAEHQAARPAEHSAPAARAEREAPRAEHRESRR